MCVALFSGAGLESSEELEEGWEYVKEVALAEDNPARLAFPCPPHRPTNTVLQREPVGVLAGTAAPAQMYDEIERPGKLFGAIASPIPTFPTASNIESDSSSASCCCSSQLLDGMVDATEGAGGTAGAAPRPNGSVVGAGSRDGADGGTQVRIPPWPDAGRHVKPVLYFAFSASGSAFQRWPGGACGKEV